MPERNTAGDAGCRRLANLRGRPEAWLLAVILLAVATLSVTARDFLTLPT